MNVFVCVGGQLQCFSTGAWQSSKKYWLLHLDASDFTMWTLVGIVDQGILVMVLEENF